MSGPLRQTTLAFGAPKPKVVSNEPKAAHRSPENHSPQEEDERKPAAAAAATVHEPSSSHTPATKKASPAPKKPKTAASPGPSQPAGSTKRPSPSAKKSPAAKTPRPEPPPLPSTEPCLPGFPDQAKPAILMAMQMLRAYAPLLQLRAWSEERLLEDLAASDAVAAPPQAARCLSCM